MSQVTDENFKTIINESIDWFIKNNFTQYSIEEKEKIKKICNGNNKKTLLEYYETNYNNDNGNLNFEEKEQKLKETMQKNRNLVKKNISSNYNLETPKQESKINSVQESQVNPVQELKINSIQELKINPIQESKINPVQEEKVNPNLKTITQNLSKLTSYV